MTSSKKSKKKLKISYVLPVYNSQATIAQCIKGLMKQETEPYEIIILNDASTDNTEQIINYVIDGKVAVNKTAEMRYELGIKDSKQRLGAAVLRNYGNSVATGDVIAVCDADFYMENRGTAIETFFEALPEKSVFYSGLQCRSSENPNEMWSVEAYEWDFNSKCPISHPTVAYRKSLTEEISYHEDSIDTDLYEFFLLDAHRKGYLFGGCQDPLMIKVEGNTYRDRSDARLLKIKKYEEYGIKVDM